MTNNEIELNTINSAMDKENVSTPTTPVDMTVDAKVSSDENKATSPVEEVVQDGTLTANEVSDCIPNGNA